MGFVNPVHGLLEYLRDSDSFQPILKDDVMMWRDSESSCIKKLKTTENKNPKKCLKYHRMFENPNKL